MTTGKTASIVAALHARLAALVLSPVRRVAWPELNFAPVIGEVYLEPTFLPNRSDYAAVGANSPRRHRGLYQINVRGPIDSGSATMDEIADLIIEHFAGQVLTDSGIRVRIGSFDGNTGLPYRTSSFRQDGWRVLPVTAPWWADTFS